ncbi:MAG: metallophosphoesterase [Lachnospiraceae bacterium]|nr:metallophosphoesterase [Lachnospiraceae bacterium]
MAVYTVSDLHGHYDLFRKGLETIGFSDADELYVLGDVIDRGAEGIKLLRYIRDHKNMDLLLGNHEHMMLHSVDRGGRALCSGIDSVIWLDYNGGEVTFAHYAALTEGARKRLLGWLRNRYVVKTVEVNGRNFCLSHSFFDENLINIRYRYAQDSDVYNVVWRSIYREEPGTNAIDLYDRYDYTFISGHVPVQYVKCYYGGEHITPGLTVLWHGNMADIDGGCSYGEHFDDGTPEHENGMLFLRLDDLKEFPVRFRQAPKHMEEQR